LATRRDAACADVGDDLAVALNDLGLHHLLFLAVGVTIAPSRALARARSSSVNSERPRGIRVG